MPTSTLTTKGQITMPQAVRSALGLHAGDKVDFVPLEEGGFKVVALRADVRALRGRFAGRARHPVSIDEMSRAIEAEGSAGVASSITAAAARRAKRAAR
jgi:antitoxin PrlF